MSSLVLIVDDEPRNVKLVRDLLEYHQCETVVASSGLEGIEVARERHPDLILMDVQLPGLDGISVLRKLKGDPETSSIPVIVLTSYAMKYDREDAEEAGCDEYMTKPLDTRAFMVRVREMLLRKDSGRGAGD